MLASSTERSRFPQELISSCRWLHRRGKVTTSPSGVTINAFDPHFWLPFDQVQGERSLVCDNPFVFVDFDWKNGGEAEARSLIAQLPPTFTELSLSKKGAHLYYSCDEHAKLPNQAVGRFEVYSRKRQFAVTGDHVEGTPLNVTRLSLDEAREIFRLADPSAAARSIELRTRDQEPGYWKEITLLAMLEAYREFVPDFEFARGRRGYMVPCPGNPRKRDERHGGWPTVNAKNASGTCDSVREC